MKENIVRRDEFLLNLTKTEKIPVETKGEIANPNNLPFLQAQILQKIYLDLFEHKRTTIEELSELTDYPKDSKILNDAIEALDEKGFLDGNLITNFRISENCLDLFSKFVKRNDYKQKNILLTFFNLLRQRISHLNFLKKSKQSVNSINMELSTNGMTIWKISLFLSLKIK